MRNTHKNEVMDRLTEVSKDYERRREEYNRKKEAKREELGVDKFWEWVEANDKPEYPLSGGQSEALRLWYWAETENPNEELVWDGSVWEDEAHDFIDTLRSAGIETLVVTNRSTILMENMHWFKREGCELLGLCEVETGTKDWATGGPETRMGVRFAI